MDDPLVTPRTPRSLSDWEAIANHYEAWLTAWLANELSDDELVCRNHAAWAKCLSAAAPTQLVTGSSEAADLERRVAILAERLRIASEIAWHGPRVIEADQPLSRTFALAECSREAGKRRPVEQTIRRLAASAPHCETP